MGVGFGVNPMTRNEMVWPGAMRGLGLITAANGSEGQRVLFYVPRQENSRTDRGYDGVKLRSSATSKGVATGCVDEGLVGGGYPFGALQY